LSAVRALHIGGLVHALEQLLSRNPEAEAMKNRAVFLERE